MSMGFGLCCCEPFVCANPGLHVELYGSGISWSLVSTAFVSQKSVHTIRLTCTSDSSTRDIVLPAIACDAVDCQSLDMSGEFVGACDIGNINFGNSAACATEPLPPHSCNDWSITAGCGVKSTSLGAVSSFRVNQAAPYQSQWTYLFDPGTDRGHLDDGVFAYIEAENATAPYYTPDDVNTLTTEHADHCLDFDVRANSTIDFSFTAFIGDVTINSDITGRANGSEWIEQVEYSLGASLPFCNVSVEAGNRNGVTADADRAIRTSVVFGSDNTDDGERLFSHAASDQQIHTSTLPLAQRTVTISGTITIGPPTEKTGAGGLCKEKRLITADLKIGGVTVLSSSNETWFFLADAQAGRDNFVSAGISHGGLIYGVPPIIKAEITDFDVTVT